MILQPCRQIGRAAEAGRTVIFLAMAFHSIPEGVAVGVGFASETHLKEAGLGLYITIAMLLALALFDDRDLA